GLAEGPFEITEIRDGLVRRITARALPIGDAVVTGVDRPPAILPVVTMTAQPVLAAVHLPGSEAGGRIVLAAHAKPWVGPLRATDETTGAVLAEVNRPVFMGEVVDGMGAGPQHVWDRGSALEIRLYAGHLANAEAGAVLAGSNRLAIETDADDWEVVGFAEAELVAAKTYRLRKLLRGLDGTDPVMGPVFAGRRVVV